MIDAAELKRLDQLIHQLGPGGSGTGSASDENIAREIEQILADPAFNPPAAALIRQAHSPVRILWSPDAA